jgi:hypothetical protein
MENPTLRGRLLQMGIGVCSVSGLRTSTKSICCVKMMDWTRCRESSRISSHHRAGVVSQLSIARGSRLSQRERAGYLDLARNLSEEEMLRDNATAFLKSNPTKM